MGKSTKKSASKAAAAPTKPSNKGKRGAEDIIRNDNRKKRKKALVEESDRGAKTWKMFIKEKDDDYMDEQELKEDICVLNAGQVKVSAEINPIDLNPRLGNENGGVKKDASAPKETPATDNVHIDESENGHPKEEIDDGEPKTKEFKVAPSGTLIPVESNSKASEEDGGGKDESSEKEPSKMQEVEESVTVPEENNSSEEISSEEDIAASSDEAETEMDVAPIEQPAGSKRLFVGNLSYSVEQADVEDFFKSAGEIVGVRLGMGSGRSFRGFAHVEFTTAEEAVKALNELNGEVLAGCPVRLEFAKEKETKVNVAPEEQPAGSKTLFVGNLSFSVEQADVENFFKAAGEIVGVRLAMGSDSSFRGFGHVEFTTAEAAVKALNELNGKVLVGRPVRLELSKEKEAKSFRKRGRASRQTIFVRGFDKNDGEDQIRSALRDNFGSCGEITRVSIPQDKDGGVRRSVFDSGSRGGRRHGGQGAGGRFSGHQRGGRTRRGRFSGPGRRGCGRATPGRS